MNRIVLPFLLLAALVVSGCGGAKGESQAAAPVCPKEWRAGWQKLADRIGAPVYCPRWMPSPLVPKIGGPSGSQNSVDPDGSYLIGFIYKEGVQETHVNFRGYPGRTAIPTCIDTQVGSGKPRRRKIPCFSDPGGQKIARGIVATVYTVNQDADQWHVLYAWRHDGSLYTLSEHVAPPYGYAGVRRNLDRMLRNLVLLEPQ